MSLDQSSYPDWQWDLTLAHDLDECPDPGRCDNGHPCVRADRGAASHTPEGGLSHSTR